MTQQKQQQKQQQKIHVAATVNAPVSKVWKFWNSPEEIMQWNTADPTWHCPRSENDLIVGGKFKNRMEAKDGSFGFDFEGVYDSVKLHQEITYTMSDGREANILFSEQNGRTQMEISFDGDGENDPEFQRQGWQSILNNFVQHVESKNHL